MMGILKQNGACCFWVFLWGHKKNEIYIKKKKKEKKEKKKKRGNWDLISFPHCSNFIGFTGVYIHNFMLNCRLYST